MMRRAFGNGLKRAYSSSGRACAEPVVASSNADLIINFCTPHQPIYNKKIVEHVIIPGAAGEYGITAGHSPLISQLEPGVVQVIHVGGAVEKFFVPGGFAITQANSVTDISVPEAVSLADLDESSIRAAHADATQLSNSSSEGSVAKATAMIEIDVYAAMGRALGFTI